MLQHSMTSIVTMMIKMMSMMVMITVTPCSVLERQVLQNYSGAGMMMGRICIHARLQCCCCCSWTAGCQRWQMRISAMLLSSTSVVVRMVQRWQQLLRGSKGYSMRNDR